jgi:hypothetical protein
MALADHDLIMKDATHVSFIVPETQCSGVFLRITALKVIPANDWSSGGS